MNRGATFAVGIVMLAAGAAGGYWLASTRQQPASPAPASQPDVTAAKVERKILYYRNPMGLPDTSPTPKKDPMGMDYVPVYAGDEPEPSGGQVKISVDKVQKLGVRTEPAAMRSLEKTIKVAGRVEVDERRVFAIAPKFEGWVEKLYVNATGQVVNQGQPLFDVYSPELVSAQREYLIASEGVSALKDAAPETQQSMRRLAESSLARLKNWDVPEDQIHALAQSAQTRRTLTFRSPVAGVVTEKKAVQGMRFMPGDALYQIADLSSVWVIADVYEQDIAAIRAGARAKVAITAYPDKSFEGRVTYVYPTLKPETRTIPVRVELSNPGHLLKPGMFAQVELASLEKGKVLTVPTSAVIDSGARRIVLVQLAEGRFEPREVKVGARSDSHVEILGGVKNGESVVVSANFLIDAESNLKAAIGGFSAAGSTATPPEKKPGVGHQGEGTVKSIDPKTATLSIAHSPIPSLKWQSMTMDFKAANPSLLVGLKPGAAITFEIVERAPGEWIVTKVGERRKSTSDAPAAAQHKH